MDASKILWAISLVLFALAAFGVAPGGVHLEMLAGAFFVAGFLVK